MAKNKTNIGLYVSDINDDFTFSVCKGAFAAAGDINANLILFPGMYLNAQYNDLLQTPYYYQYNTVYDIGNARNLDILIIMTGNMGNTLSKKEIIDFLKKYPGIPILTISSEFSDYHSIKYDNKTGLKKALNHLIHKHGCRKIGFVSGSRANPDARERLEAYCQTLLDNEIPVDQNLITYGNFSEYSGNAVGSLLDENPDIDAICFANDAMAKGGYKIIKEKGYSIGKNLSVIGFDNSRFSVNLSPPLTTVNANSFELGYEAVIATVDITPSSPVKHITIPTTMIVRSSCGCKNASIEEINNYFSIKKQSIESLCCSDYVQYVFSEGCSALYVHESDRHSYLQLKKHFSSFIESLMDICSSAKQKTVKKSIYKSLSNLIKNDDFNIIPFDVIYNVLDSIHYRYAKQNENSNHSADSEMIFTQIYREISTYGKITNLDKFEELRQNDDIINAIANDVIITGEYDSKAFYPVMKRLSSIGFESSYLLLFDTPIMNTKSNKWAIAKNISLCFVQHRDSIRYYSDSVLLRLDELFNNPYIQPSENNTLVLSPLFSNEELYGLLICDTRPDMYKYLNKVSLQISTAIKYIMTLNKWQNMLTSEKENSKNFEIISKHDELTGIFNRRGFFDNAQTVISNPGNEGKNAIVVFADMDNLKVINDQFGHDDGDYSLQTIANILLKSFRNTDIVGRIGGDEFAVFALLGTSDSTDLIETRIKNTTDSFNRQSEKLYYVNMSVGLYSFVCHTDVKLSDILEKADVLLYKQKKNKRKNVYKA
ncbi:MAG: GGDEF domain-containing protein [Oscillospiraceae bacterium]|nr:GGDEF domain-containing protein [Oscillospiraceae bacterium]